jgi:hypothetical protein
MDSARVSPIQRTRLFFLALLAILVPACAGVQLVSSYDEETEKGLSSLYLDTTQFVDRMISLRGQPAGGYAANQQFYTNAMSRVDLLIARSRGYSILNNCPTTGVIARLMDDHLAPEARAALGQIPEGDCQTVVLELLRGAYADMRTFHEAQEERGIPPSARDRLLEGGVGSLLRTALTIQVAKRAAQTGGER